VEELKLFGMRIKELRTVRKLSQGQLAKRADISAKYVSRIETGQHFPSFDILKKLANALDVELKDFFEFTHEGKNTKDLKETIRMLIKEANDEKLKLVVKLLRAALL